MDSFKFDKDENKIIKKAYEVDNLADEQSREFLNLKYPVQEGRLVQEDRRERARHIIKNQIVANKDVESKFNIKYTIEAREKVFLYEDKKEDAIGKKIRKYRAFSDKNNEELKAYSVRFTNRSAGKRADAAKDARKLYARHNTLMQELTARANEISARDGKPTTREVKSLFKDTLKSIDLRTDAMIAAAKVKSTSKDDELFRIVRIKKEMANLKVILARKYQLKYQEDRTLNSFFKNSYLGFYEEIASYADEYEQRLAAVKGRVQIEIDDNDDELLEDDKMDAPSSFLIAKRRIEREKHYDNSKINSVRGAIVEQGERYQNQLSAKDDLYKQNIINNRIQVKNHSRKGHEYSKDGYVIKFNVLGTMSNFENYDLTDDNYKIKNYFGMPVNGYNNALRVKVSQNKNNNQAIQNKLQKISLKGTDSLLGGGQLSIDNSVRIICEQATERLGAIFESWRNEEAPKKTIHLMFSGVSRGGVTVSLGAMAVNEWVSRMYPDFLKYVKYDIIQHDPVPGPFVSNVKNQIRIGGATNEQVLDEHGCIKGTSYKPLPASATNSTVFYCFHPNKFAAPVFQPQQIFGANKIILSAYEHGSDSNTPGMFRMANFNKKRSGVDRTSFLNNENGEFYTGTGISDLEDGIYVLDEFDTLTKIKNYEDAERIFNRVRKDIIYSKRKARVLEVVKYWFATHRD